MSDIVKKDDFYLNIKNILQFARDYTYKNDFPFWYFEEDNK